MSVQQPDEGRVIHAGDESRPRSRAELEAHLTEKYGTQWSRLDGEGLIIGTNAERAAVTVQYSPIGLAEAFMRGEDDVARTYALRIALARDALPTTAERGAVPYGERLGRTRKEVAP